ncbi:hypothetical protein ABIE67_007884 [Streptomyces sp. V4I8]
MVAVAFAAEDARLVGEVDGVRHGLRAELPEDLRVQLADAGRGDAELPGYLLVRVAGSGQPECLSWRLVSGRLLGPRRDDGAAFTSASGF